MADIIDNEQQNNDMFKSTVLGHPQGLFILFFTEMWERFSYYGMRALLVLFLMSVVGAGGWNWGIDSNPLPINQKSSFRLECIDKKVTLTVNGNVWNQTQPATRPTGMATIYAGNPWYPSANALMENLCYVLS